MTELHFYLYFMLVGLVSQATPVGVFSTSLSCREKCDNLPTSYPRSAETHDSNLFLRCSLHSFSGRCNNFTTTFVETCNVSFSQWQQLLPNRLKNESQTIFAGMGTPSNESDRYRGPKFKALVCLQSITSRDARCGNIPGPHRLFSDGFLEELHLHPGFFNGFLHATYLHPIFLDDLGAIYRDLTFDPPPSSSLHTGAEEWHNQRDENNVQPSILDWSSRTNGRCLASHVKSSIRWSAWQSKHIGCDNTTNDNGYICRCLQEYDGHPYIPNGYARYTRLLDVYLRACFCNNTEGSYECTCTEITDGDKKAVSDIYDERCYLYMRTSALLTLGVITLLNISFVMVMMVVKTIYRHCKRHFKEKINYQRYYRMMAGRLQVFSKQQIKEATNNYDESRILGTGGQGKVYMGYSENNQPVAIKIPKEIEEIQVEEFANEILLLSQLNHKNIVRLIGCCIEVKVPILVYEFVPNGTLHDLLLGKHRNRSIYLGTRLKIALDSAEALDYLHSCITRPILHGDVKSANILLDNDHQAKVSDFGASNLVPIDDSHVVKVPQGTRGYIDPEYANNGVLTKKSDVYSFGVVLLELITRKYAIFGDENSERKHLASCFVSNSKKDELNELLDKDIVTNDEKVIEILDEASELAMRCVRPQGADRPTMKQVVEKLQYLVRLQSSLMEPPNISEDPESSSSERMYYTPSDTCTFHSTGDSSVLEIQVVDPAA